MAHGGDRDNRVITLKKFLYLLISSMRKNIVTHVFVFECSTEETEITDLITLKKNSLFAP